MTKPTTGIPTNKLIRGYEITKERIARLSKIHQVAAEILIKNGTFVLVES
jgi:hypothetical protein